jgi:hypothetical protein
MSDEERAREFARTMNDEANVIDWLTPFLAALAAVRAEEREVCAKVAENEKVNYAETQDECDQAYNTACDHIADAIRMRLL